MSLNILNYLDKDSIILGLKGKNKKVIIATLIDHLIQTKKINKDKKKEVVKILLQREEMGSTAIGGGIAFPHARLDSVKDLKIVIAISSEGVDFDSLDQDPVHVITLLLSNKKEAGLHLKMLAFLARMLRDKYFAQQLGEAKTPEEVLVLIKKQQKAIS